MAKRIYSTVLAHANDADFQAWASELFDELIAAGLEQTADTGQLSTPVSAARPGSNTSAGYWMFRFDDSLQGSAPVFIRIEVGTGSSATVPRIMASVGTGTNGSGTISGAIFAVSQITVNSTATSAVTPYTTYINHDEGHFSLIFKSSATGAGTAGYGRLLVYRTCNDDTTPNGDGYWIARCGGGFSDTTIGYCGTWGGTIRTDTSRSWCLVPFVITSSTVGSDNQCFKVYGTYPEMRIVPQVVVVIGAELTQGNTTGAVEIVDGVTHNYLSCGPGGAPCTISSASTTAYNFAILWD